MICRICKQDKKRADFYPHDLRKYDYCCKKCVCIETSERQRGLLARGLCITCGGTPLPNTRFCLSCTYKRKVSDQRYHQNNTEYHARVAERKRRLREDNRCITCGIPLQEGETVRCINCNFIERHPGITQGGYK